MRGIEKRVGDLRDLAGVVLTESVDCSSVIEEEHVIGSRCDLRHWSRELEWRVAGSKKREKQRLEAEGSAVEAMER